MKQRTYFFQIFFVQKQPLEVFYKKIGLRNFAKFTRKYLCKSLFFNKIAGLRPEISLQKRLWHRYFPANFAKFLRTPFLTERIRWLLLFFILTELKWLACLIKNCFFMDWFCYDLIILIKYCKIPYKNLNKTLLFSRNQVFCLKIWKLW